MKQMIINRSDDRKTYKSFLDRLMDSGAEYMANFAVIRGSLPSTNSAFFQM